MQRSLLKDLTRADPGAGRVHVIGGLAGHPLYFRPLARALSRSWRMRGLLYPIWAGGSPHCPSVEALAAEMAAALEDDGAPVILFGYSFGGTVAYAIAFRLARDGRRAAVVMLDSSVAELRRRAWRKRPPVVRLLLLMQRGLRNLVWKWPRSAVLVALGKGQRPGDRAPREEPLRSFHFESLAASRCYVPPRSDVPIVMIRAVPRRFPPWLRRVYWPEKDRGWSDVAPVVGVVPCIGTHKTVARPANVDALAPAANAAFEIAWQAVSALRDAGAGQGAGARSS